MSTKLNWLHLTDLHTGLDGAGWLWPQMRVDFLKDLRERLTRLGGIDVVFFTGDLTQSGREEEFSALNRELEALWKLFKEVGCEPVLCAVPGNHDLQRPDVDDPYFKALLHWSTDSDLRNKFWRATTNRYRDAVAGYFSAYTKWSNTLPVPTPEMATGLLPGDYCTTIAKGDIKVGVLGLNSSFLQLSGANYKSKLAVHTAQLANACGGDVATWLEERDGSVLLTHHPADWLLNESREHFRADIYPPSRFLAHFCGHQHEPAMSSVSEGGGHARRVRVGRSLFGLESWIDEIPHKRSHGYDIGQFEFTDEVTIERAWPRRAEIGQHGALRLRPDQSFDLDDDNCVVTSLPATKRQAPTSAGSPKSIDPPKERHREANLFEASSEASLTNRLARSARFVSSTTSEHLAIRLEEQSRFETALRTSRLAWLVADWGVGRDGFLAAALHRFRNPDPEVFQVRCETCDTTDEVLAAFKLQLGLLPPDFGQAIGNGHNNFIFLEAISAKLATDSGPALRRLIEALRDLTPHLGVIISSRQSPTSTFCEQIELLPLEPPDVKTYVTNHRVRNEELDAADAIHKLHERSGGLPMHLDRMLRGLEFGSLATVLESELERRIVQSSDESTPKALIDAVSSFAQSSDPTRRRSFYLLKALTLLPHGETLDMLRHYFPSAPIFPDHAAALKEAALLEIIQLRDVSIHLAKPIDQTSSKVLRVPRQVADYVSSLISADERDDFTSIGADRLLGERWTEGVLKLRRTSAAYRDYLGGGLGNEFWVLHALLVSARRTEKGGLRHKRAARISTQYAQRLFDEDRYRDVVHVGADFLQLFDKEVGKEAWVQLMSVYGRSLRMIGQRSDGIEVMREALHADDGWLSASTKATLWLSIALGLQSEANFEAARDAARQTLQHSTPHSNTSIHAEAVIAECELTGSDLTKRLYELEREAREKKHVGLAATIVLTLLSTIGSVAERLKLLERLEFENDATGYTPARIDIAKASAIQSLGGKRRLSTLEVVRLTRAYSYLYSQRLESLFDSCHQALWTEWETAGAVEMLARLFRFSSFVWRIRGEADKERDYALRLQELAERRSEDEQSGTRFDFSYFARRAKVILVTIVKQLGG